MDSSKTFDSLNNEFYGLDDNAVDTFLNDIFFFLKDTSLENYARDTTLYAYNKNLENAISYLRQDFSTLSNWFYNNYMLLNTGSIASCCLVFKIMSNLI